MFAGLHGRQLRSRDARGAVVVLGKFAEGLGGHVDAGEHGVACGLPARHAAVQHKQARIAEGGQGLCGAHRYAVAVVRQHDARRGVGGQAADVELQPAKRERHRIERMAFAILAMLADIEQGDLVLVMQPALEGDRVDLGVAGVGRVQDGGHAFVQAKRGPCLPAARGREASGNALDSGFGRSREVRAG